MFPRLRSLLSRQAPTRVPALPRGRDTFGRWLVLVLAAGLIIGCSGRNRDGDAGAEADADTTEAIIYRNAQRSLRSNNFTTAIRHLESLEARFPFGGYAEQAQLELIYARFMAYELDAAQAAARRFIRLHPQNANVDYAYYMNGLAAYKRNAGFIDRLVSSDQSRRDTSGVREAFNIFNDMLKRYPDSEYAPDARLRMIYLRDLLAQSEVNVASYYMSRGAYVAAANRARYVVENFSACAAAADALAVGIEANWRLGLEETADDLLRVLALNFPDYRAFDKDGNLVFEKTVTNRERSWLNLMTLGLLDRPDVPPPLKIDNELIRPSTQPTTQTSTQSSTHSSTQTTERSSKHSPRRSSTRSSPKRSPEPAALRG